MGIKCWRGERYKEYEHNFVGQIILLPEKIAKKEERLKKETIFTVAKMKGTVTV